VPRVAQSTDSVKRNVLVSEEPHQAAPGRTGIRV
jgi:hypothetical protein